MSENICCACSPQLPECKNILASLKKSLVKLNSDYEPDFKQENQTQILNDLAFRRLVDILFSDDSTSYISTSKCSHYKFIRYLRRKLKCNSRTFNSLCNQLIEKIAERNYHLSILGLQIKSAQLTSGKLASNQQLMNWFDHKLGEERGEFSTLFTLNMKSEEKLVNFRQNNLQTMQCKMENNEQQNYMVFNEPRRSC